VVCKAQAFVFAKLMRLRAGWASAVLITRNMRETGGDQQGVGKDVQHFLSPFHKEHAAFSHETAHDTIQKA
jgi:hypothetical protein